MEFALSVLRKRMIKDKSILVLLFLSFLIFAGCQVSPAAPRASPSSPSSTATHMLSGSVSDLIAPTATPAPRPTRTPQPTLENVGRVDQDVTYCTADGVVLKMDIYYPLKVTNRPAPIAVNVHGGAWQFGDKTHSETLGDIPELLARGYLVAAVDYRLAPKYKFPAQLEDVKCAVRYLRANASKYDLDSQRIGAWGCSAGGQLVAMLGVTDGRPEFEGSGGYRNESSGVQAVVALSAPADLVLSSYSTPRAEEFFNVFGAASITDPILTRFSPVHYVSKNASPFLILGGDKDRTVPLQQSEVLYNRLRDVGASATLQVVKNAHHCMPDTSPPMEPSRQEITRQIADFFDRELR